MPPDLGTPDSEDVWYNALHGDAKEVSRALSVAAPGSVNHRGVRGWTPLFAACARGHADVAKILLEANADTDLATTQGWRPLMTAAQQGSTEIVRLLLQHSADVTAKNQDGQTVVVLARLANVPEVVRLLEGSPAHHPRPRPPACAACCTSPYPVCASIAALRV